MHKFGAASRSTSSHSFVDVASVADGWKIFCFFGTFGSFL